MSKITLDIKRYKLEDGYKLEIREVNGIDFLVIPVANEREKNGLFKCVPPKEIEQFRGNFAYDFDIDTSDREIVAKSMTILTPIALNAKAKEMLTSNKIIIKTKESIEDLMEIEDTCKSLMQLYNEKEEEITVEEYKALFK